MNGSQKTTVNYLVPLLLLVLMVTIFFVPQFRSETHLEGYQNNPASDIVFPASTVFTEDFSTTTYMDAGATTVADWGTGAIRCPRNTMHLLYLDSTWCGASNVYSVELQGRKLYSVSNSLRTHNVSNPQDIRLLGGIAENNMISSEIHGDLWAVGYEDAKLRLFDVSDPNSIGLISTLTFPSGIGNVTDIEFQGHHMYVAVYNRPDTYRLQIYDVEDPTNPQLTDKYPVPSQGVLGIDVQGDILCSTTGLYINTCDVSSPYSITPLGSYLTPGNATDVLIDGDYAYVADGPAGVQVIDCSDPTSLSIIDSYNTPGNAMDVELQGDTLCVADGSEGVCILDVSDPSDIRFVDQIIGGYVRDIDIHDGRLAIAKNNYVYIYQLGLFLISPNLYAWYPVTTILDVAVQGTIAYTVGTSRLQTWDVSDPSLPHLLDTFFLSSASHTSVDVQGSYCYVARGSTSGNALLCFNVSDPNNIEAVDSQSMTAGYEVDVAGDVACYADGTTGLIIANLSLASFGTTLDVDGSLDNCSSVAIQGHYAFAGGHGFLPNHQGVICYNLDDLSNIVQTDWLPLTDVEDIDVCGDFLAVANGNSGVSLVNITDPYNIYTLDSITFPVSGACLDVKIFGNYILAITDDGRLYTINAFDPMNLQIDSWSTITNPRSMTINGDFLFVACRKEGTVGYDRFRTYRIFRSHGDSWDSTSPKVAQSLEIDTTDQIIENATLTPGYGIDYGVTGIQIDNWLSADNGAHWEQVQAGVQHSFTYPGNQLRWKVELSSNYCDRTPRVDWIQVEYEYNAVPTTPVLTDPGSTDADGSFIVSWSSSSDPEGFVDYYLLQMGDSGTFSTVLDSWQPSGTSQAVSGLSSGLYYFRVQAVDNDGNHGAWSNIESITVAIVPSTPVLDDPGSTDADGAFTLSWSACTDDGTIDHYLLQMGDSGTFSTVLDSWQPSGTSQAVSGLSSGLYYFRVQAVDNDGYHGDWSNWQSIEVIIIPTTPTLAAPSTPDAEGNFEISWSASSDDGSISQYLLQISTSDTFSTVLDSWVAFGLSQSISGLNAGTYYLRVRAVDDDGNASPWSNVQSIVISGSTSPPPPPPEIPGFPWAAIFLGLVIGCAITVFTRRSKRLKNIPT